jgi:saccharopine dehydrogenase-like NADP-dependent oxidoreductase
MKIAVLGTGLVGGPMVKDLLTTKTMEIIAVDLHPSQLNRLPDHPHLTKQCVDLSDAAEVALVTKEADLVISAVPGFMGFATVKNLLEARKNVIDISFMPEDPESLNDLAIQKGVFAVVDCGVAPGMSNILLANATLELDEAIDGKIMVGGLPVIRNKPWEYKAVFSPADVMEEYTRPARVVVNGTEIVKEPLSEVEWIDFEEAGTLEAFITDGLRSLARTLNIRNMSEKTLRYPGYTEKIRLLKDSGFLATTPVTANGLTITPLEYTSALLFPKWKLEPGEEDITVMQIYVEGKKSGKQKRITWDLFDRYDPITGVHSMARTTGYTATSVARILQNGYTIQPGILFPEKLGSDQQFTMDLLEELKRKDIFYRKTVSAL